MERDFVQKHDRDRPEMRPLLKSIYDEVVGDLVTEVREAAYSSADYEERSLRLIAGEAILYAREFTRNRSSPVFEARRSKAQGRLEDALKNWQHHRERKAAEREAERQAAMNAPRRKRSATSRQPKPRKP